jgi:hypothetical protein
MVRVKITPVTTKHNKKTIPSKDKKFPKVPKEKEEKDKCCICISDIPKKKKASLDCCNHVFCRGCIEKWAKTENSCPLCKRKFKTITSLKKGCKKKKETVEVEDKRQRPDDPEADQLMFRIQAINEHIEDRNDQIIALYFIRLSFHLNEMRERDNLTSDTLTRNFDAPESYPVDIIYTPPVRELIMIYFFHHTQWRHLLLGNLARSMWNAIHSIEPTAMDVKVQMIFNVINRFMTNARLRASTATESSSTAELFAWMDSAKFAVFGNNSSANAVHIDEIPTRPIHPALVQRQMRSKHIHVICGWCEITGEDPEWLFDNMHRSSRDMRNEDYCRFPVF